MVVLATAIILLFVNVLFPTALNDLKLFYVRSVRGDSGITSDITGVFNNVTNFLTAASDEDKDSGSSSGSQSNSEPSNSSDSSKSDNSSSSSTVSGSESSQPQVSSLAMGMGGEENPLPLARESAGLAAPDTQPLKKDYVIPLNGRISSGYGYRLHPITGLPDFHKGIDIPANAGTPIKAFRSGTVVQAETSYTFGQFISIDHGDGVITRYGHCSELKVAVGDQVTVGSIIGLVGNTGYSTGNHLHFDISKDGVFIDPLKVIPSHTENGYAAV